MQIDSLLLENSELSNKTDRWLVKENERLVFLCEISKEPTCGDGRGFGNNGGNVISLFYCILLTSFIYHLSPQWAGL